MRLVDSRTVDLVEPTQQTPVCSFVGLMYGNEDKSPGCETTDRYKQLAFDGNDEYKTRNQKQKKRKANRIGNVHFPLFLVDWLRFSCYQQKTRQKQS